MTQEENDDNSDGYSGHHHLEYVTQEENYDHIDGYSGYPRLEYVTQKENDDDNIDILFIITLSM